MGNFWSLLKRSIGGTYVAVEPFHLFRYVDEQSFQFNNRLAEDGNKLPDFERFSRLCSQVVLLWAALPRIEIGLFLVLFDFLFYFGLWD